MSGSTIGGVVGGVVGFFFGSPQIGWMIGSAIGGYVDPDVIKGPRLKDAQVQTSMEGAPRAIVFGKASVAGNIIQTGPLVETKHKERTGKGGPVQVTYSYSRSYAIRVCEGPIAGIARIWRDDKLVYDVRDPDVPEDGVDAATWAAQINAVASDTAATAAKITIYLGDETQLPDPTLEGLPAANGGGAGNVPAYRGTAYVVFTNDDLTDRQGTVPQYRFEVVSAGTASTEILSDLAAPTYSRFVNASFPLANPDTDYDFVQVLGDTHANLGYGPVAGSSIAEVQANIPSTAYPGWGVPDKYMGYMAGGSSSGPYTNAAVFMEGHGATTDIRNYKEAWLVYNWQTPTVVHDNLHLRGGDPSGDVAPPSTGGNWHGDALGCVYRSYTTHDSSLYGFIYSMEGFTPLAICLHTKQLAPVDKAQPGEYPLPDKPGWVVNADGVARQLGTYVLETGSYRTLALESVSGVVYTQRELGPVLEVGDANDTSAYWTAAYNAAVAAGTMPAGMTYDATGAGGPTTYPRNKTTAYRKTYARTRLSANATTLATVVTSLCSRTGVTADKLDVTQLTDVVRGAVIGQQMSCSDALSVFRRGYFFDLPEWGDSADNGTKLRGIKRGGPALFDITDDDLVWSDDDADTRAQAVEFPRKINLISPDPTKNYEPTKQTSERRTDNIKAVGEATIELPLSQTGDERAQTSDKMLKLAWTEAEGTWERQLPPEYSVLTPSDPFNHSGKRWRAERVEVSDGVVKVEAKRDRPSAYTSSAVGNTGGEPTIPPSSIKGPTVAAFMNLPQLRTQDNTPGMYVAVRGLLSSWPGCLLYLSVDGGLTDSLVATITTPATMGTLTADFAMTGTTLSVEVGNDTLESVTPAQIAAQANAFAIVDAGNVAEIGQFQTATETGSGFDLTTLTHPELGTTPVNHVAGEAFVMLDTAVVFLPISVLYAGKTLIFRPVTIGTEKANNATYSVVYRPMFTSTPSIDFYETDLGEVYTTNAGTYYELS